MSSDKQEEINKKRDSIKKAITDAAKEDKAAAEKRVATRKKSASKSSSSSRSKTKSAKASEGDAIKVRESGPIAQNIAVAGLAVALVLLTLMGAGMITISCLLGIGLCIIGFFQRSIKVDWWIFAPLLVFIVFDFASSFVTYGNLVQGYASFQLIYVVIYALVGCLNGEKSLLLKKLAVLWVAFIAVTALFQFTVDSFSASAGRLDATFGNANSLGIFMTLGWFALLSCRMQDEQNGYSVEIRELLFSGAGSYTDKERGKQQKRIKPTERVYGVLSFILPYAEPFILVALILTLSMGSILALIIGLVVYLIYKRYNEEGCTWKDVLDATFFLLSKIIVCFLAGLFMYLAAERARMPFMCEVLLLYTIVLAILWKRLEAFLKSHRITSIVLSCASVLCAGFAIVLRPSALATFSERFAMMGNGLKYMSVDPILGVGPYKWRYYNLADSDTYYNVWHIHDLFIHMGAEIGLIAMIALVVIAVRCFMKKAKQAQQGENAAFLVHMLIDTGFFIMGIVSLFIMTAGNPQREGSYIKSVGLKVFFLIVALLYIDNLYVSLQVL